MSTTETTNEALSHWILQVRWALEACHEHVGTDQLRAVIDAESKLLVALDAEAGR